MSHGRHKHHHGKHKHKHKHHHRAPTTYPKVEDAPVVVNKEKVKTHAHHVRSEAMSDANRFFHQNELKTQGAVQTTNVTVNINDKDDCMTSCFSSLAKCFGK